MQRMLLAIAMLCISVGIAQAAENAVKPGEFIVERPTLLSLGFEWKISGDDNRNAAVEVTYRRTGSGKWNQALPANTFCLVGVNYIWLFLLKPCAAKAMNYR